MRYQDRSFGDRVRDRTEEARRLRSKESSADDFDLDDEVVDEASAGPPALKKERRKRKYLP